MRATTLVRRQHMSHMVDAHHNISWVSTHGSLLRSRVEGRISECGAPQPLHQWGVHPVHLAKCNNTGVKLGKGHVESPKGGVFWA
jgi:hypothetical protein